MTILQDEWDSHEMPGEKNPEMSSPYGHLGHSWTESELSGVEGINLESMPKQYEDYRCVNNNNNAKYSTLATVDKSAPHRHSMYMGHAYMNGHEPNGNLEYMPEYEQDIRPRASSFDAEKYLSNSHVRVNGMNGYSDAAVKARERFLRRGSTSVQTPPNPTTNNYSDYEDNRNLSQRPSQKQVISPPTYPEMMHHSGHMVHDGYATLTRPRKSKSKPVRASHDTGLGRLNDVKSPQASTPPQQVQRTVVFPQQPLSSSFDAKILRLLQAQQQGQNGAVVAGVNQPPVRPTKLSLSHTMHALPQHDIHVHHARSVYLRKKSISETTEYRNESQAPYANGTDHLSLSTGSSTPDSANIESPTKAKSPLFSFMSARFGSLRRPKKAPLDSSSEEVVPTFKRSNSTPNIMEDLMNFSEDDDEDNDDYGFLSFRSFRSKENPFKTQLSDDSASDMQKAKSAGQQSSTQNQPQSSILPKKWRKSKPTPNKANSAWKPQSGCTWSLGGGKKVALAGTHLLQLTEVERLALRKLAHSRLQSMDLGCTVTVPKDHGNKRSKRGFSLKKRNLSAGLLDGFKEKTKDRDGKDAATPGRVFGLPLGKVIANDAECSRRRLLLFGERRDSTDLDLRPRNSSTSSVSRDARYHSMVLCSSDTSARPSVRASLHHPLHSPSSPSLFGRHGGGEQREGMVRPASTMGLSSTYSSPTSSLLRRGRTGEGMVRPASTAGLSAYSQLSRAGNVSSDSLSESDSRSTGSTLLDALSLSSSGKLERPDPRLAQHVPHVPYILDTCFKHIQTHGVQVTGIFRIGSSKKRVKQLREEFDQGQVVELSDEHSAHDVGGLLKEFLRDLADPLLTRDLYSAFLATTKLKDESERNQVLRLLVTLLPVANRDTLYALLNFLNVIVRHSTDQRDINGTEILGNKMDSNNLATLFGPNILHKAKGREFEVESLQRLDERGDVIAVVKALIDNYTQIFELPVEVLDEVYKTMAEASPEALDVLLRRKLQNSGCENEAETGSSHCDDLDNMTSVTSPVTSTPVQQGNTPVPLPHNRHSAPTSHKQYHNVQVQDTPRTHHNAHVHEAPRTPHTGVKMRERVHSTVENPTQPKAADLKASYRKSTPEHSMFNNNKSSSVTPSRKSYTPNLHIRVSSESPIKKELRLSEHGSAKSLQTPRSGRKLEPQQDSHGGNLLTVPSFRDAKERASNSSLSSGYFGSSSRSGTTSPTTPEVAPKWYMDTPPDSPPPTRGRQKHLVDYAKEASPAPFQRTSSLHRPLGITPIINVSNSRCLPASSPVGMYPGQGLRSPSLPQWQMQRWRHWEQEAKERGHERQEQETLV